MLKLPLTTTNEEQKDGSLPPIYSHRSNRSPGFRDKGRRRQSSRKRRESRRDSHVSKLELPTVAHETTVNGDIVSQCSKESKQCKKKHRHRKKKERTKEEIDKRKKRKRRMSKMKAKFAEE